MTLVEEKVKEPDGSEDTVCEFSSEVSRWLGVGLEDAGCRERPLDRGEASLAAWAHSVKLLSKRRLVARPDGYYDALRHALAALGAWR